MIIVYTIVILHFLNWMYIISIQREKNITKSNATTTMIILAFEMINVNELMRYRETNFCSIEYMQ